MNIVLHHVQVEGHSGCQPSVQLLALWISLPACGVQAAA